MSKNPHREADLAHPAKKVSLALARLAIMGMRISQGRAEYLSAGNVRLWRKAVIGMVEG